MILYLFTCIQPFRRTLLFMLAPSDISRLLTATRCTVTATERGSHMNVLDDIFKDSSVITAVSSTGNGTWVNRVLYCATGTEFYISSG
jgi:hypothetical protein